jgi:hypothetical protein
MWPEILAIHPGIREICSVGKRWIVASEENQLVVYNGELSCKCKKRTARDAKEIMYSNYVVLRFEKDDGKWEIEKRTMEYIHKRISDDVFHCLEEIRVPPEYQKSLPFGCKSITYYTNRCDQFRLYAIIVWNENKFKHLWKTRGASDRQKITFDSTKELRDKKYFDKARILGIWRHAQRHAQKKHE